MFNDYVWRLYLKSGGNKVVQLFEDNLTKNFTDEYIEKVLEFHQVYCSDEQTKQLIRDELEEYKSILQDAVEAIGPVRYSTKGMNPYTHCLEWYCEDYLLVDEDASEFSDKCIFEVFTGILFSTEISIFSPVFLFHYIFHSISMLSGKLQKHSEFSCRKSLWKKTTEEDFCIMDRYVKLSVNSERNMISLLMSF